MGEYRPETQYEAALDGMEDAARLQQTVAWFMKRGGTREQLLQRVAECWDAVHAKAVESVAVARAMEGVSASPKSPTS